MGNGATRTLDRVAAAIGLLGSNSAEIEFHPHYDVSRGGVLTALPALLAVGLLRYTEALYRLPAGFYGIDSIFLLLALMAMARIRSLEQLRYEEPGEWGKLLGLDRIPEVRTLRAKLKLLCENWGRALEWNSKLARDWMAQITLSSELFFYCDGHVRVYHGDQTKLPRHYVARERLCLRATTDYWVCAMDGQPFLYVNKEVDPGLIATLEQDVIPWLEAGLPQAPDDPLAPRFTVVFDREGYSPVMFQRLWEKRIAVLTYHKYPHETWRDEEFQPCQVRLEGGELVTMKLAERGTQLSNKMWVREIRKLRDQGHQTSILTTNFPSAVTTVAPALFARWCQENFFRYMRDNYGLDRLVEFGTEPIPDTISAVNPLWRKLDSQIRSKTGQRLRMAAQFGSMVLSPDPDHAEIGAFQQQKGELQEHIESLDRELIALKEKRKQTPRHIPVNALPEQDRFTRLRTERKHFVDTIKMIAYRAETTLASSLRQHLARSSDDARSLARQIFDQPADLIPDFTANTLTVQLHHFTQAAHDQAVDKLLDELNATQTIFPGTRLTLNFKIGSS
jgi:hypothetical protein